MCSPPLFSRMDTTYGTRKEIAFSTPSDSTLSFADSLSIFTNTRISQHSVFHSSQNVQRACGVQLILNVWAYMLGMDPSGNRSNTMPILDKRFYRQTVRVINRANRGHLRIRKATAFLIHMC